MALIKNRFDNSPGHVIGVQPSLLHVRRTHNITDGDKASGKASES
jgi:hypothetical protein